MKAEKGYFKWVKKAVWVPDEKGKFILHPNGMVLKEGEGTVIIKGFDPLEELKKRLGYMSEDEVREQYEREQKCLVCGNIFKGTVKIEICPSCYI